MKNLEAQYGRYENGWKNTEKPMNGWTKTFERCKEVEVRRIQKNQKNKKKKGVESSSSSKFSEKIPESFPVTLNSEAKYRNSILGATMYNEYLKNERTLVSKHFLKRKLKSAFEREPLDKCKGFFNVPFIPTMNMFNTSSSNTTSQQTAPQNSANNIQNSSNYTSSQNGNYHLK